MKGSTEHIIELLKKYRNHTATEAEFELLFNFLQNPENLELLRQEFGDQWKTIDSSAGFSPLHWEDVEKEVRRREARERKIRVDRQHRRYLWTVAASVLLIVGLSAGIFYKSFNSHERIYQTGFGQVESIVLDDGSKVTLNANSTLSWNKKWEKNGVREVVLSGEAYFEVQSIEASKSGRNLGFEVVTKDLTIDVVGTSFNVKSREEKTAVYLDEGEVHLNLKREKKEWKEVEGKEKIVMQPGESVSYSNNTQEFERSMGDRYGNASWTSGTFVFTETSVAKVLRSLEDIYGKKFEIDDFELLDRELTAGLPYSDWTIVKSALELLLKVELMEEGDGKITIGTIKIK